MRYGLPDRGIYAITNSANLSDERLLRITESILSAGVKLLQYRNKDTDRKRVVNLGKEIMHLCNRFEVPLFVNDDPELAIEINAAGVHLGKEDADITEAHTSFPELLIGVSCYNNMERAIIAEEQGADYVAFGSFFRSATKPDAMIADIDILKKTKTKINIPIVAIGGITPENGQNLLAAGADFLAVISGIYAHPEPYKQVKKYLDIVK